MYEPSHDAARARLTVFIFAFVIPSVSNRVRHPDAPEYVCRRGVEHDSITFYSRPDEKGKEVFRFFRYSTGSADDGIWYLMEYEGYSYPQAVTALATFQGFVRSLQNVSMRHK